MSHGPAQGGGTGGVRGAGHHDRTKAAGGGERSPRVRSPVTSPPSGQPAARRPARRAPGYGTTIARAAYGGRPIWRRGPVEVRRSPARVRRRATTRRRSSAKVPIARARTAAGPMATRNRLRPAIARARTAAGVLRAEHRDADNDRPRRVRRRESFRRAVRSRILTSDEGEARFRSARTPFRSVRRRFRHLAVSVPPPRRHHDPHGDGAAPASRGGARRNRGGAAR